MERRRSQRTFTVTDNDFSWDPTSEKLTSHGAERHSVALNRRYKSDMGYKTTLQRSGNEMSRTAKRHTPPAAGPLHSEKMRNQEFARKLFDALIAKGWKQSRLARECFGTMETPDGHIVARGRDRISSYVRGTALPDPVNLHKIATALGTTVEELAPDIHFHSAVREEPEVYMSQIPGQSRSMVKIERPLDTDLAIKVIGMIVERDAENAAKRANKTEIIDHRSFARND
jgi:transcriptional regulator with XRE-family HTH domain